MNTPYPVRETWPRFKLAIRSFFGSPAGRRALWWLALLVVFLLSINGLNVVNSYVGRDFISAIENKDAAGFTHQAWLYLGVFALSTIVAVMFRFAEERLGLLWRDWQTRQVLDRYLSKRVYYQLEATSALENPDQRISEDIRTFTTTTLSFGLMTLNASFTVIAFSGVLWTISPRLFLVAVVYALVGSLLTLLLGRKLIGLNDRQLDKEANFRSELIHIRDHAESVALLHREARLRDRLVTRLNDLIGNARHMIGVNRNLSFFTTGYNYLIQIMPALIVAPLFIKGKLEFGVITQSAMAFAQLMGAFSLIVTQFQSISSYAAVIARLGKLVDAMDHSCTSETSPVQMSYLNGHITYDQLSLFRHDGRCLLRDLTLTLNPGTRVLVASNSGHAKAAIFKATAGLCSEGTGNISRPDEHRFLFLPERPYLPKGTLRELLLRPELNGSVSDESILESLRSLKLESIVQSAGGLHVEHEWCDHLAINEQAQLAIARVLLAKPEFVFLDRLSITMDGPQASSLLKLLTDQGITYLVLGKPEDPNEAFDAILTIESDATWSYRELRQ
jgi:putative ATP-binding cassette transporter